MSCIGERLSTTKLVRKITIFAETLCGKRFYAYQVEFAQRIFRAILENDQDTITGLMARQCGKSYTVSLTTAAVMIILPILANMPMFLDDPRLRLFRDGMKVGIFAPCKDQSQIIFDNVKDFFSSARAREILESPEFNISFGTFNGNKITLIFNNLDIKSSIVCKSASDGANVEGGTYHLCICDESQDISNYKYRKSIFPTTSHFNGTKILIGTPTIKKNFFYDAIQLNKSKWKSRKIAFRNHLEYDSDTIIKYNPYYAKTVQAAIELMGEGSEEFLMNYKLKWLFNYGMFINSEKFLAEPIALSKEGRQRSCEQPCYVGIDVGKANDSTVVTVGIADKSHPIIIEKSKEIGAEDYVIYDVKIVDWLEIVGDNYEQQFYEIMDYLKNFNVKVCIIDGTGVGSPVADRLAANVSFPVIPFVFTPPSKSMLMKYFNAYINANCFHYPSNEETQSTIEYKKFQEQCVELTKDYRGNNLVVAAPKERNKHDDYPFSAALMVWSMKHQVGDVEEISTNKFIESSSNTLMSARRGRTRRYMRSRW